MKEWRELLKLLQNPPIPEPTDDSKAIWEYDVRTVNEYLQKIKDKLKEIEKC